MTNSITPIGITLDRLSFVGKGLKRPECTLCTERGDLYIAHRGDGVMHIAPDGSQRLIGGGFTVDGHEWIPNGIALLSDGTFLIANMGEGGGVWTLHPDGRVAPFLMEVDGEPLAKANFVFVDDLGRIWITMTTRSNPMSLAMTGLGAPETDDGFICLVDDKGARIVADGLSFSNEARLDRSGRRLYIAETFGRRISRYRVGPDGSLTDRETFASFGHGTFADGIAFDAEDCLWIASIVSNRLIRISPDGTQTVLLEDSEPAFLDRFESALLDRSVTREMAYTPRSKVLKNIASIAFGGPDLKTVYLGSLAGDTLAVFRSPVAGVPLPHWKAAG